jgi:CHAT domain-containing protein
MAVMTDRLLAYQLPIHQSRLAQMRERAIKCIETSKFDESDPTTDASIFQEVGEILTPPIVDLIARIGATTVYFSLQGDLYFLPIDALPIPGGTQGETIGDRVNMLFIPSAALLPRLQPYRGLSPAPSLVAFGNPSSGSRFSKLEYAEKEVGWAAEALGANSDRVFVKDRATVKAVESNWDAGEVLLFSCHGDAESNPLLSYLVLHDDVVLAHEIVGKFPGMHRTKTVVLSACSTGASDRYAPDEALGLMSAFLMSGAPLVLATRWPVGDVCAAVVVREFLLGLKMGKHPSSALQTSLVRLRSLTREQVANLVGVQKNSRRDERGYYPFKNWIFWAPFFLLGRMQKS